MKTVIRRPIFLLVALIVMPLDLGLATTLWAIGAFVFYFTITSLSALLVSIEDMLVLSWKIRVWFGASLIFAIALFLFLFIRLGEWAAIDFIILIIAIPPLDRPQTRQKTQMKNRLQELLNQYNVSKQAGDLKQAIACLQELLSLTPADSPHRAAVLDMLAQDLETSYKQTGKLADLDTSIQVYQQALRATQSSSPDLPRRLISLSIALYKRFELPKNRSERNISDLNASIAALQQAIPLLSPDDPIRPTILKNLEIQLHDRYIHNKKKDLTDLEAAIAAIEQAIEAIPAHAPERSGFLEILGRRQHERYQHTKGINDLDASIATNQQALQAPPHELLDQPTLLSNLARGLGERYEQTGERADLEAAFAAFEQASRITPPDSHQWLVHLDNLSNKLRERYKQTGNQTDLDAATAAFGKAVQITTSTLPDQYHLLSSLGKRQFEQYHQTGDLADLEMALTLFDQALKMTHFSSLDRIAHLNDRGVGLRERYIYTRSMADLEAALDDFQHVVDATPSDSPDFPLRLNNLIVGLSERIKHDERSEDLSNLRTQISNFEHMKAVFSNSPTMLNSLGGAWLTLYERTDELNELNAAIRVLEPAIQFATDSFTQSMCFANLGTALSKRYEHTKCYAHTKNRVDLDAAIINFQQASQLLPADSLMQYTLLSNLARSLYQRFADFYNLADLEAAISALERCWSIFHGRFAAIPVVYQLGQQRQESAIVADLAAAYLTQAKIRAIPASGRLLQALDDVNGSKSLLVQAIATFALSLSTTYQARREQRNSQLLSIPPLVLEIIEGHKSRLLTQLVGRGLLRPPPGLSPDKATREQQLLSELTRLDTEELVRHDNLYALQEEESAHLLLPRLQQRQRAQHELEDLWSSITGPEASEYIALRRGTALTWQEMMHLMEELGSTTALLSLIPTPDCTWLFLLRAGWNAPRVVEVQLDQEARLNKIASDQILESFEHQVVKAPREETWYQKLLPSLHKIRPHIEGIERLILSNAGFGHFLPWAVLLERAGCQTSSGQPMALITLPSLSILPGLRQRPRIQLGSALVCGNPRGEYAKDPDFLNLPYAETEAMSIAKRFDTQPFLTGTATKAVVEASLSSASLIHLATHAKFDDKDPLESHIVLADGKLTAREILSHRLQADLVVISACESGLVGSLGGEERAGLSQAFLQAGARSLLLSLWKVNDPATTAFMEAFYTAWLAGADKALALQQAMLQVRQYYPHAYYWGAFILVGDWSPPACECIKEK